MSASNERLDVRVPARADAIPRLREAATAFAREHGLPDPGAVGLAVTEAATNVVLHAYPDGEPGDIRLVMCPEPERLVVVVRDWGAGMRPRPDSPGLGVGLPTIATVVGAFSVEAADGAGTLLRMHFDRVRTPA
jgi:serine/threonine-protein kinase RsbW/stage II sporulation protein AB (anti-sigma F factor)